MKAMIKKTRNYYKYVETENPWTQPQVNSAGTMGVSDFAVASNIGYQQGDVVGEFPPGYTTYAYAGSGHYVQFYSNTPICISKITFNCAWSSCQFRVSDNGTDWTTLDSTYTIGATIWSTNHMCTLTINDNTEYHKYYRIYNPNGYNWTSSVGTSHPPTSITITATQKDVTIVEGTESDYDFYKDTYTTNLLMEVERKYYKYGTTPNVTLVGNPTVNDGVISGFSTSNYAKTPSVPSFQSADSIEYFFKIKIATNTGLQWFFMNSYGNLIYSGINLRLNGGLFELSVGNGSNNIFTKSGSHSVQANTDYWLKFIFNGSSYILSYSLDGETFVDDIVYNSTSKPNTSYQVWLGNFNYTSASADQHFYGSIDLKKCYIKINGEYWWHGTLVEEATPSDYDFYEDINTYKAIKSYEKGQYYGN